MKTLLIDWVGVLKRRHRRFGSNENGQIVAFFAVVALVMCFTLGTVTEYGTVLKKAVKAQTAADAAALAGGTWLARSGNISQIVNGIHYDLNFTVAQILALFMDILMVVITVMFIVGAILAIFGVGAGIIQAAEKLIKVGKYVVKIIGWIHKVVNWIFTVVCWLISLVFPTLALLNANQAAFLNGADSLDEIFLQYLRENVSGWKDNPVFQKVLEYRDKAGEVFPGINTWTVSPSILPTNHYIIQAFKYDHGGFLNDLKDMIIPLSGSITKIPLIGDSLSAFTWIGKGGMNLLQKVKIGDFEINFTDQEVDKITEYTSKVIFWTFFNWWNLDPRNWKYASPYELTWFGGTFMGALPYWFDQLEMCEWNDTYLLEKRQVKAMTMDKADFFTLFIPSVSGFLGPIQGFYEWFSGSDDEESEGGGGAKSLIGALIDKLELPESIPVINVKTEDLLSPFAYILQFIFDLFSDEDIDFVKLFTEPLPDCVFEEQGGGAESGGYEPEELHHFTYVVAIKSKPGMFLKVFGPTIGEKKPYRDNVPITWAFATVAIKGHHIYPGGLYRTPGFLTGEGDDPFTEIQTMVVPYFIASWPPLTQLRLIMPSQDYTYQGDWKATLIPVKFRFSIRELLLSIPIINLDKPFLAKVDADVDGKYLGFNH